MPQIKHHFVLFLVIMLTAGDLRLGTMAYLIKANALQLMHLFQQEWLMTPNLSTNVLDEVQRDLLKSQFLGSQQQAKQFVASWQNHANPEYYAAGDVSAGHLSLLFKQSPLQKEDETEECFYSHYKHKEFAYVNTQNELCGLLIMARQDDPSQWMIGLITNTNLPAQDKTITLLASFDLNTFIADDAPEQLRELITSVNSADNPLVPQLHSPFLVDYFAALLTKKPGELSSQWQRINHLLRTLQINDSDILLDDAVDLLSYEPQELVADNLLLDKVDEGNISLSATTLQALCDQQSSLYQALIALPLTDHIAINTHLLTMAIYFYEQGILPQASNFLHDHVFNRVDIDSFWDEVQIQLIPHLILEEYPLELFQFILSHKAYYDSVLILTELGLEQSEDKRSLMAHVPVLFNDADKLNELDFIFTISDRDCRALCLIYWAKQESAIESYQNIILACQEYPYLAASLCARSKQGKSTTDLSQELSNPKKHLQHSLINRFALQFERYQLDVDQVKQLLPNQLINAHKAFELLQNTHIVDAKMYQLILANNNDGLLWRLFLPDLANLALKTDRQNLIHFLHVGVLNGIQSQGKIILDEPLTVQGRELRERFICVKQMLDLGFSDEIIVFTANQELLKAKQLRSVILKVEQECKSVHERLSQSTDKYAAWQKIETKYRQSLYTIAYQSLINPGVSYAADLARAQQEVLDIVDPATTQWWSQVLITIANALILLFSGSIANKIKEQRTGNYWFFTQSRSGELIRNLEHDVLAIIENPEPYLAPN